MARVKLYDVTEWKGVQAPNAHNGMNKFKLNHWFIGEPEHTERSNGYRVSSPDLEA